MNFKEFFVKTDSSPITHKKMRKPISVPRVSAGNSFKFPKFDSGIIKKASLLNQPVQKSPAEFLKRGIGLAPTTNKGFQI